jgi:hypothetical protein
MRTPITAAEARAALPTEPDKIPVIEWDPVTGQLFRLPDEEETEEDRKLAEEAMRGPFIPGEVVHAMVEARVRHEHDYTEAEGAELDALFMRAESDRRARGSYPVEAVTREIEAITKRGALARQRRAEAGGP